MNALGHTQYFYSNNVRVYIGKELARLKWAFLVKIYEVLAWIQAVSGLEKGGWMYQKSGEGV